MKTDAYRISGIELRMVRVTIGIRYATDTLNAAHALVVHLAGTDAEGWGEVFCPVPDPMWDWALRVAPLMTGRNAFHLDALLDDWPTDRPRLSVHECGTYFHPDVDAVAEAFSIAVHDLVARRRGIPFRALLGTPARTRIPGMPVIGVNAPATMAADAAAWAATGIRFVKIKLSGHAGEDAERVMQTRAALPRGVEIQVDANGSYPSMEAAAPLIATLNACRVEVIEDLFDIDNLSLCRDAREALHGRYMVDKDAHWPRVLRVLEAGAADVINQHPHNQGRMSYALRIAEAAGQAGIETAIGSSGIVGIQSAAYQQLAAVIGLTRPCEDIGMMAYYQGPVRNRFLFDGPPTVLQSPPALTGGDLVLTDSPGLGVSIDRKALERLTVSCRHFPD